MRTITKNNHIAVQIDAHPTLISILQITLDNQRTLEQCTS